MRNKVIFGVIAICLSLAASGAAQKPAAQKPVLTAAAKLGAARVVTIVTEPAAAVWLNDLRRGTTDASGRLIIEKVQAGAIKLRVRKTGFAEKTVTLTAARRGEIAVELTATTDAGEIAFQEAEFLSESGSAENRRRAAELYRTALAAKPRMVQAHVGLARVLNDLDEPDAALGAVAAARQINPKAHEASTVEGRIYRRLEDADNAIKSFRRAIREAGLAPQPEARTGLALAFSDKSDYENAAKEYKIAVAQLADTEPVIYQQLGETYEKLNRFKEAIEAYEQFLQLAPASRDAAGVRSIVEQLKKRVKGDTLELMPQ